MKLTQEQKVAIYASAFEKSYGVTKEEIVKRAIEWGDAFIEALEAKGEKPNPHEPITD